MRMRMGPAQLLYSILQPLATLAVGENNRRTASLKANPSVRELDLSGYFHILYFYKPWGGDPLSRLRVNRASRTKKPSEPSPIRRNG